MKQYRIVVIDDHAIFIQGLSLLIGGQRDFHVTGSATNAAAGETLIAEQKPDMAIIDLNLGDEDGLDLIKSVAEHFPETRILVLSMLQERYYAERSLAAGARGYVMKDAAADTLIAAMRTVLAGKIWLSDNEQKRYIDSLFQPRTQKSPRKNPLETLSNRQLQIFRMLGRGHSTPEMAQTLSISTKTVDAHKEQLKKKLDCASAQELLRLAISWNKDAPPE
ncbi:MAG TPA: response regulator transcription factor [Treponemataceae bacterium]|nr:response regulator transcription factor [Treponemataceae bacterium]HQF73690.1 response regulator transcription factor [Treponemataceae bacterium]